MNTQNSIIIVIESGELAYTSTNLKDLNIFLINRNNADYKELPQLIKPNLSNISINKQLLELGYTKIANKLYDNKKGGEL